MLKKYFLSPNVFISLAGDYFVFLDLKNDRYYCLNKTQTALLSLTAFDWPRKKGVLGTASEDHSQIRLEKTIQLLVGKGLIMEEREKGRDICPLKILPGKKLLLKDYSESNGTLNLTYILQFYAACLSAAYYLKWCKLEKTVERIKKRKHSENHYGQDVGQARKLTSIFTYLRPFYPKNYNCLFESLALLLFLAKNGLHPDWLFGIKTDPFTAHCWVQQGQYIFNDRIDFIEQFSLIMVV